MKDKILEHFPIKRPYRFIDDIHRLEKGHIHGSYTFREDELFYEGHFPGMPVTPGAILSETMAQIGLLAYGISLMWEQPGFEQLRFLLVSSELKYRNIVQPGERVDVYAEEVYFRFRKLKCRAKMEVAGKGTVCRGTLSGMIIIPTDEEQ